MKSAACTATGVSAPRSMRSSAAARPRCSCRRRSSPRLDPATGRPKKYSFGPWIFNAFGLLAKMKGLRGTAFDIFGYSEERREERAAIGEYEADVEKLLAGLNADNAALANEIAALPLGVRGFGPVKAKAAEEAKAKAAELWARWPGVAQRAAA
jgi:indolepyruvate ferredoxin oxidoreductase